jgi:hypothetical protein
MCVFVAVTAVAIVKLHFRDPTHNASARLRGWPVSKWVRDEAVQDDGAISPWYIYYCHSVWHPQM